MLLPRHPASLVEGAAALLFLATGCRGAECKGASSLPPVGSLPVAPSPPEAAGLASVPATAMAAEEAQGPLPTNESAEARGPETLAPDVQRVILVDETPHYAVHWRLQETAPDPAHGHAKLHGRHGRPYHPAPGIIVDVVEAHGGAHGTDVQRIARSAGYWPFRRCYEEGLRRDQRLAGKVSLDMRVAPTGSVERSTPTGATLRDDSVVACVAREARGLSFAPSESPTDAAVDVTLATGDEPVPVARPVPNAERLREVLRTSQPAVEQCYASELTRHPDAGGHMELRFRVGPEGEILEVAEDGDPRFGDMEVTRCVLGVYRASQFPGLDHAIRERTFVYGLHFESRPELAHQP
jgi:hypothetical protein